MIASNMTKVAAWFTTARANLGPKPASTGWDGIRWDGIGWDGMEWDGMGWDGMGCDGMGFTILLGSPNMACHATEVP